MHDPQVDFTKGNPPADADGSNPGAASEEPDVTQEDSAYAAEDSEAAGGEEPGTFSNVVIRRVRTEPAEVIPPAPQGKGFLYTLLDTLRFISLGLVIGVLLVVFVVQRNDVYGDSMKPTLHENDAVFVEMVTKYFHGYQRGNIVTINATGMPGYSKKDKIIKRVVGLPGETVIPPQRDTTTSHSGQMSTSASATTGEQAWTAGYSGRFRPRGSRRMSLPGYTPLTRCSFIKKKTGCVNETHGKTGQNTKLLHYRPY